MKAEAVSAPSSYVPDSYGRNLYEVDPQFDALLRLYLPGDLFGHLRPHLVRLGGLAGSTLDRARRNRGPESARAAPSHAQRRGPPVARQASGLRGARAVRLLGVRPGGALASRRGPRLARPDAARREVRPDLPVRAGGVRSVLSGEHDRLADADAAQVRLARARRALSAGPDEPGHGHARAGRHVHDRARRRVRCRCDRDGGPRGRRRQLAPLRRQVVLLQPRRRAGDGAGAPRGVGERDEGAGALPPAERASGWLPNGYGYRGSAPLPLDRAAERRGLLGGTLAGLGDADHRLEELAARVRRPARSSKRRAARGTGARDRRCSRRTPACTPRRTLARSPGSRRARTETGTRARAPPAACSRTSPPDSRPGRSP